MSHCAQQSRIDSNQSGTNTLGVQRVWLRWHIEKIPMPIPISCFSFLLITVMNFPLYFNHRTSSGLIIYQHSWKDFWWNFVPENQSFIWSNIEGGISRNLNTLVVFIQYIHCTYSTYTIYKYNCFGNKWPNILGFWTNVLKAPLHFLTQCVLLVVPSLWCLNFTV